MDRMSLEKAARDRAGRSRGLIGRLCGYRMRGIMNDEDIRLELYNDAMRALEDVFEPFGIVRSIGKTNYAAFSDAYDRYLRKEPHAPAEAGEWLYYDRRRDVSVRGAEGDADRGRMGAPAWAKEVFFGVLREYGIPAPFFMPLPDGIPDPHALCLHSYARSWDFLIRFECVGGDAFFDDRSPAGKEFCLTDRYGLRARIFVERVYSPGDKAPFRNRLVEKKAGAMAATGTVEGYTTGDRHSLEIEREGDRTVWIFLEMSPEDTRVYLDFALWRPYFEWEQRKTDLLADVRFARFEEECDKRR